MKHTVIVKLRDNFFYIAQLTPGSADIYRVLATMTSQAAAEQVLDALLQRNMEVQKK